MAKTSKKFTVKVVTERKQGTETKKFYAPVGVMFLNESDKGLVSAKLILHLFPGTEIVAFPDEPKEEAAAGE